ncbi:ABC transporter ATP-binding protein [Hyphomonas sp.]|uniref:ABC transporter ATP-binding protein n=1 Tax=Hyphomonas sp. TaxID=87 RepID=UPI003528A5C1
MVKVELNNVDVDYPVHTRASRRFLGKSETPSVGGYVVTEGQLTVRALENISLSLKPGDRLGLLGRNGAGKTTLLKTIAGILPPVAGTICVEGRISPLTSILLGLDGESTGYENIGIRGRLMGMSEADIREATPEIAEFTELGDFLHLPIKTYSSGMRMRLSFATSTAFQPDVLLLDEWLGTGDIVFREKAAKRLRKLIFESGIFVFASHSRDMHQRLSNKGAVIDKGRMVFFGDIEDAFRVQDEINETDKP